MRVVRVLRALVFGVSRVAERVRARDPRARRCVIHPFNTIAVRRSLASQGANAAATEVSLSQFVQTIVREEGAASLYNGLSAGCARQLVYMSARIGFYEKIRDAAAMVRETDFAQRLVVGAVSGGIAAVVSCPMEVTVVRMSNDASLPAAERRGYTSLGNAFRRIVSEEGAATFFRGATPYINRCMMVGACQVATYDQFKSMLAGAFAWARESPTKKAAVAALMSGYVYSVCTMPFEVRARARVRAGRGAPGGFGPRVDDCATRARRAHRRPAGRQEPHGVPEARRVGQAAVHGHAADHLEGRDDRGRDCALSRLFDVLRALRRAHGHLLSHAGGAAPAVSRPDRDMRAPLGAASSAR